MELTTLLTDSTLSLEARAIVAHLVLTGKTSFSLEDMRSAGAGRDAAYHARAELRARGLARRVSGSKWELLTFTDLRKYGNPEIRLHTCIESRDQSHVVECAENPEIRKSGNTEEAELSQQTLQGLPEDPTPSSAAPPPRPRRTRAGVPEEARALYPALFDLTKSPRKGRKAMGVYTIAKNLHAEFQATPEQVTAFWEWFKTFSEAARHAARERRQLNPPMPRQVYEAWPQFLPWWEAREAAAAREAARAAAAAAAPAPAPLVGPKPDGSWPTGRELLEAYRRPARRPEATPALMADARR